MRRALAPLLFEDAQRGGEPASFPVTPTQHSPAAQAKVRRKGPADNLPIQSFRDLLRDLATLVKNRIQPTLKSIPPFEVVTRPTPLQKRALELLDSNTGRSAASAQHPHAACRKQD
jgi:hypothetical protein